MGAPARWFKALISNQKSKASHGEQDDIKCSVNGKSKRWLPWKLGSSKLRKEIPEAIALNPFETCAIEAFGVVGSACEHHHDSFPAFEAAKRQWAVVRIQSCFRRFLAKRAFRALRALVRIQAIVRGRLVRRRAAITMSCMKALVKVQALVRARCVRMSGQGQAVKQRIHQRRLLQFEMCEKQGWCDCHGTLEDIQTRLQHKQQAAMKRERAMAYAFFHQKPKFKTSKQQQHLDNTTNMIHESIPSWWWLEKEAMMGKNEMKLRIMPQITISYSGPLFSSASKLQKPYEDMQNRKGEEEQMGCKSARWRSSTSRPGYMEATISMRAKCRRSMSDPKLHLLSLEDEGWLHFLCDTPPPPPPPPSSSSSSGLHTHNLLLHCSLSTSSQL